MAVSLEEIWKKTCQHYDVPEDVTDTWYTRIQDRLNASDQPARHYHNWTEMMVHKREHLEHVKPSIILAAFFQYYHFNGNRNCAKENCEEFEEFCRDALFEDESSKCLILKLLGDKSSDGELSATSDEDDANLLQDLDLAILAAPSERYKHYTELLRREYKHLNDDHYKAMRLKVLETLMLIPNIYSTPEFQSKYEEAARINIRNEIDEHKSSYHSQSGERYNSVPSCERRHANRSLQQQLNHDSDDVPSTSNNVMKTPNQRNFQSKHKSGQRAANKIIRSIKLRKSLVFTPLGIMPDSKNNKMLKRKLNFGQNKNSPNLEIPKRRKRNMKVEDEQNISRDEILKDTAPPSHADDNDCICIADEEVIVLDDDDTIDNITASNQTIVAKVTNNNVSKIAGNSIVTSTPYPSRDSKSGDSIKDLEPSAPGTTPFFIDKEKMPWFETIRSTDNFSAFDDSANVEPNKTLCTRKNILSPDEVITIDDTLTPDRTVRPKGENLKRKSGSLDDSVIFIDETKSPPISNPDFISLTSQAVSMSFLTPPRKVVFKSSISRNSLFSSTERRQFVAKTAIYNPAGVERPRPKKRMIIIDGSNVAYAHSNNKYFSVKGVEICIEFFEKKGHEVKAVVPQARLQYSKSSDPATLERLAKDQKIIFTPCKNLPGKSSMSYDDRIILDIACTEDAAIVSNDNYRDLLSEKAEYKKLIENRVVGFTWCNDTFILPSDPYGRWGPSLDCILNRKS